MNYDKENGIYGFDKTEYNFLSNMAEFDSPMVICGHRCNSSENFYQAMKSEDPFIINKVLKMRPKKSKVFARHITIRKDWAEIKEQVMLVALRYKFKTSRYFRQELLKTGDRYIEETNDWKDHFWGVCDGKGKNRLGYLIMVVRDEIKSGDNTLGEIDW